VQHAQAHHHRPDERGDPENLLAFDAETHLFRLFRPQA
jgi:hypothetical protein